MDCRQLKSWDPSVSRPAAPGREEHRRHEFAIGPLRPSAARTFAFAALSWSAGRPDFSARPTQENLQDLRGGMHKSCAAGGDCPAAGRIAFIGRAAGIGGDELIMPVRPRDIRRQFAKASFWYPGLARFAGEDRDLAIGRRCVSRHRAAICLQVAGQWQRLRAVSLLREYSLRQK